MPYSPIKVFPLKTKQSDGSTMTELIREDWFGQFNIKQAMLSVCKPDTIKAWHRHDRGQNDCLTVLYGSIKLVVFENGKFYERVIDANFERELIYYPGRLWHGFESGTNQYREHHILYFIDKLYDYNDPDEERRPFDCEFENGLKYQW